MLTTAAAVSLTLLALFAAVLMVFLRQAPVRMVARFELVRLARKGRQPLLRGLVVTGTLAGLLLAYMSVTGQPLTTVLVRQIQLPPSRLSQVAETFLLAFLAVQLLAVYLAAPVILAASVAREKELKTLEMLLNTALLPWDVAVGKFLAGWYYVFNVAVAGVPALIVASYFGGIDLDLLLASLVVLVYGSAGLGAAGLLAASKHETLQAALGSVGPRLAGLAVVGTVGLVVPLVAFASPLSSLLGLVVFWGRLPPTWTLTAVGVFALLYAGYAALAVREAARRLTLDPGPRLQPPPAGDVAFPEPIPVYGVESRPTAERLRTPTIPDDEMLAWKERLAYRAKGVPVPVAVAVVGPLCAVWGITLILDNGSARAWAGDSLNPLARIVSVLLLVVAPLRAGTRAASAVSREHEAATLESLVLTLWPRPDLLRAKFHAATRGTLRIWAAGAALLAACALAGGVHPLGVTLALSSSLGLTLALGALGLYLSVRLKNTFRATQGVYLAYFLTVVLPVALSPLLGRNEAGDFVVSLSPPVGGYRSATTFRHHDWQLPPGLRPDLAAVATTAVATTTAAAVLWLATVRRFGRVG